MTRAELICELRGILNEINEKEPITRAEFCEIGLCRMGYDLGFISTTVFNHYNRWKIYQLTRDQENGHIESVDIAAKLTRSSRGSTWRAVKFFK